MTTLSPIRILLLFLLLLQSVVGQDKTISQLPPKEIEDGDLTYIVSGGTDYKVNIGEELETRDAANRARTNHTGEQSISTVTGLQAALDDRDTVAELNARDVANRDRINHTGAQAVSTVTGLQAALDDRETIAELDARSALDRARANHTGEQAVSTVTGLQTALDARVIYVEGTAALTSVTGAINGGLYQTRGWYSAGDGGGNLYRYVTASTATCDGGFVVDGIGGSNAPAAAAATYAGTGTGRFIAVDQTGSNPKKFGAKGDGVTDDTARVQASVNAALTATDSTVLVATFPKGTYLVSTIDLPKALGEGARLQINGYGAVLKSTTAAPMIRRMPLGDGSDVDTMLANAVEIRGFRLMGNNLAGQKGIQLGPSYMSVIEDVSAYNLDTGIEAVFCLALKVNNCKVHNCNLDHILLRTGIQTDGVTKDWTTASNNNSQCNIAVVSGCRVYSKLGALSTYKVLSSNGVEIRNCISEGHNPQYGLYVDGRGATTVKTVTVTNFHSENAPTVEMAQIRLTGGVAILEGVYHVYAVPVLVSGDLGDNGYMVIRNWGWYDGSKFKTVGNTNWMFENIDTAYILDDPARWDGGVVPGGMIHLWAKQGSLRTSKPRLTATSTVNPWIYLEGQPIPDANNTRDLGRGTTNEWRTGYFGTGLIVAGTHSFSGNYKLAPTIDFPSIPAGGTSEQTVDTTGLTLATNDHFTVSVRYGLEAGLICETYRSSGGALTIRVTNVTASAIDPASKMFVLRAWKA